MNTNIVNPEVPGLSPALLVLFTPMRSGGELEAEVVAKAFLSAARLSRLPRGGARGDRREGEATGVGNRISKPKKSRTLIDIPELEHGATH